MKQNLKGLLSRFGLRLLREPAGIAMGHDLWRDLSLLLRDARASVCLDVGANHGEMTEAMLRLDDAVRVHAFEPSSKCQAILRERFGHQPRVTLVNSGLGNEEGLRVFHRYANDHLGSFLPLEEGAANPFRGEPEVSREQVPLTTLDRYAVLNSLGRVALLKIDTQGYDLRVLQGATSLLKTGAVDHVLIELNFLPLYENQPAPEEIIAFLRGHGLSLVDFYEKCRREQRLAWCTALFRKL
jgi:FkbM family methyltransferase